MTRGSVSHFRLTRAAAALSVIAIILLLFPSISSAANSPTGRNPKVSWTPARQDVWNQMVAENHPWWQDVKTWADQTGTPDERYADAGRYATIAYQWTGDTTYARKAWDRIQPALESMLPWWQSRNGTRLEFIRWVWMYDWLYPALSVSERDYFISYLNHLGDLCLNRVDGVPWGTRAGDSDETTGHYFGLALLDIATAPDNPRAGTFLNNSVLNGVPVGGLDATGINQSTLRNAIAYFVQEAAGGDWIESSEYNMGTLQLLITGVDGLATVTGTEHFPEARALFPLVGLHEIHKTSSNFIVNRQWHQWGDCEEPRAMYASEFISLLGLVEGVTRQDPTVAPYVKQFYEEYSATVGYPNNRPDPQFFVLASPYAAGADWRPAFGKTFVSTGQGTIQARDGWDAAASLFCAHMPTMTGVDHQGDYMGDFQLLRDGDWALTHPIAYAGLVGERHNTMEICGLQAATEWRGFSAHEAGTAGEYMYAVGVTGGRYYESGYYDPPPTFMDEWTRELLYLPSTDRLSDAVIIFDRVSAIDPRDLPKFARYRAADQDAVNAANGMKEWHIHMPVSPAITQTSISWQTPGGQNVRVDTLLPADNVKVIRDETIVGVPGYHQESEEKWHVRMTPGAEREWDTFLAVGQGYDGAGDATVTLKQASAGEAQGVQLTDRAGGDVVVMFNSHWAGRLAVPPYGGQTDDALKAARMHIAGYTFSWTCQTSPTKVYLMDLDPACTWYYKLNGGAQTALAVSAQAMARLTITGTGAKTLEIIRSGPADLQITTTSLPAGTVGTAYSQTLGATGGQTPYTWSVVTGTLPAGLSLGASTGTISGTPTTANTYNFTVRVTDSQGTPDTDDQALSITVSAGIPNLVITTTSLPAGTIGVAYSQTVAATGGVTPYAWSIVGGSLPAGLSLGSSTGTISGTPTTAQTSNFTVRVTDSQGTPDTDDQALSITINSGVQNLVITTTSLPGGVITVPYSQTLAATGGVTPYTWSVVGGSLPPGLSLGASTGTISGTPTTANTYNFTVRVTDSQGTPDTDDQALSITITSGGADPLYWQTSSDTVSQTTSATYQNKVTLTFTPTAADDYLIIAFAEHSVTGYGSHKARLTIDGVTEGEQPRRQRVNDWYCFSVAKFVTLAAAQHNIAIDFASIDGGTASIRSARVIAIRKAILEWSQASADTQVGINATPTDYVTMNFTPSAAGDYLLVWQAEAHGRTGMDTVVATRLDGVTVQETDVRGGTDAEATPHATFSVANLTAAQHTLTIQSYTPNGTGCWIRRCRVAAIRLTGGRFANYAYQADDTESTTSSTTYVEKLSKSWTAGANGNWLALLSSSGGQTATSRFCDVEMKYNGTTVISNTLQAVAGTVEYMPTTGIGVFNVVGGSRTMAVNYRSSYSGSSAKIKQVHLALLPLDDAIPDLVVTTTSLPAGQIGVAYSQTVQATGGVTPYSWSTVGGSLPAGLSLASSTGVISGTPTTAGTSNFTVRCTDSQGTPDTDDQALSIYIPADLVVTTTDLAEGRVGSAYSQTLSATGGVTAYSWSTVGGSLPAGLSLSSGGVISGTPTTAGTSNFTVRVTDSQAPADTDDQALSISIYSDLSITTTTLPGGMTGVAYSEILVASGGKTPYSWSLNGGSLPSGLTLWSNGTISGTPTTTGTSNFTVRCTDAQAPADTDDQALSITVTAADLAIITMSLPSGQTGVAYSQTLAATGGVTPYTWSIVGGALPTGLSLGSSTGTISGTPTTAQTANFTARVTDSQGTPDTDDQALSIAITSGGGDPLYWQTSSDTVSQTTSTTYQNKVTLSFTPTASDEYLIIGYAEHSVAGYGSAKTRLTVDGVTEGEQPRRQRSGDWFGFSVAKFVTLGAAQHNIAIDFATIDGDTASIRSARVIAIRKAVLEWYQTAADGQVNLTGTPTDYVTMNFTPSAAGDYLLVWQAEVHGRYNMDAVAASRLDGVTVQETDVQSSADGDAAPHATFVAANLTAAQHTLAIRASTPNGTGLWIRRARVAAIRLTGGRFANYAYQADDTESATSSTTYVQKLSRTWTAGANGNWLALMSSAGSQTATGRYCDVQLQYNASTVISNPLHAVQSTVEYLPTTGIGIFNVVAGARTMAVNFRTSNGTSSAKIKQVHLALLPLDDAIPDLVVTTTSLPDGAVGAAYSQTLAATGGVTPYTWSVVSGSLPSGLTLGSATGTISGTPTAANTYNFTVRATDSQGTPDTDDQALSIIIAAPPATYQFAAADTESNTTSTTYQTKTTLNFTTSVTDDWVILSFAEYKGSSESQSVYVRTVVDGVTESEILCEPNDATDYMSYSSVKVRNLAAGAHAITLDYRSEATNATARIRNARIVAVRKAALEVQSAASESTAALTTTMTNYATLTFTPASAAEYLMLYSAEVSANTGYSTLLEARVPGGSSWDNAVMESKDNTDYFPWLSAVIYTCPASSLSFSIAAAKETGSSATHNIRKARIVAIRLDGRFGDSVSSSSDTEATTTSTAFVEKYTKTWTWGVSGNWLLVTSGRVASTSASYSVEARAHLNDTTALAQPFREPNDTTDYMQFTCFDVRSLSGTKKLDVDYRSENASATAKIRTVRFCGVSLDD